MMMAMDISLTPRTPTIRMIKGMDTMINSSRATMINSIKAKTATEDITMKGKWAHPVEASIAHNYLADTTTPPTIALINKKADTTTRSNRDIKMNTTIINTMIKGTLLLASDPNIPRVATVLNHGVEVMTPKKTRRHSAISP